MHFLFLLSLLFFFPVQTHNSPPGESGSTLPATVTIPFHEQLYRELDLSGDLEPHVLEKALAGYEQIDGKQKPVLTLIDFSKPSTEERLFVIDMENKALLYKSHVAHGRNSGSNYAVSFSNRKGSYQSSLGFYLTENTYMGKNGYSLVLNGLEPGINDNAKPRAVVIHGSAYANPSVIAGTGRLGRSLGCPALPQELNKPIIDAIKGGTVLYIHAEDEAYHAQSLLQKKGIPAN